MPPYLIFDGDYPMAYGALDLNRDLTLPIEQIRAAPPDIKANTSWPDGETMASLPEMRRGRIATALVKAVGRIQRSPIIWGYRSGENAYAAAQAHMAYYHILEQRGQALIIRTAAQLQAHTAAWEQDSSDDLPVGFILGLEGADPVLWPEQLDQWWDQGLRVISLSHYGTSSYCHGTGTGTEKGLLAPAKDLLKAMDKRGLILDLTHASDASVRQALDLFAGPIIATHQNCRALVPGERQFPDEQLQAIIDRDGVIGVSMDAWMLYKPGVDWANIPPRRKVYQRHEVTLEDLADHIDHICQLAGNARHAGLGGDTDGQGGREGAPWEIDTVADYQKVAGVLEKRGYGEGDIAAIMYGNWQRFFAAALPAG
ncbi:MAG: peptidase M19 [Candidatus Latescibacteria bacterium]|nr:peptidase M19 [Candidatus Latescibacterota bacterium]